MKKLILTSLLLSFCNLAFAGPRSDGGGQGTISPDGQVQLVDLLTPEETSSALFLDASQVRQMFYEENRYVTQLAREDQQFFQCAKNIFEQNKRRFPSLQDLLAHLKNIKVLQVQFQIPSYEQRANFPSHSHPLPLYASTSRRVPSTFQFALAAFANNQIWVSERLYLRLSQRGQCGLAIHEGLRLLNFSGGLREHLMTSEIELLTRHLMGITERTIAIRNQLQVALAKLTRRTLTAEENYQRARDLDRRAAQISRNLHNLNNEEMKIAEDEFWNLTTEAMRLRTQGTGILLQNPLIQQTRRLGIADSILIQSYLTERLNSTQRWDVLTLQKVEHDR